MAELVDRDSIEEIVGCERQNQQHMARAVTAEQTVYILHSHFCLGANPDLRECIFSQALDNGVEPDRWEGFEDRPVQVLISWEGRLVPARQARSVPTSRTEQDR